MKIVNVSAPLIGRILRAGWRPFLFIGLVYFAFFYPYAPHQRARDKGEWEEQQNGFRISLSPYDTHVAASVNSYVVKITVPAGYRLVGAPTPILSSANNDDCFTSYNVTLLKIVDGSYETLRLDLRQAVELIGDRSPPIVWTQ